MSQELPVKVERYREQRRGVGRPTELNEDVAKLICDMVRMGCTYEVAAIAAGVSARTFQVWKQRGKEEKDGIYAEFLQDLAEAEAQGEVVHLGTISKTGADGAKFILAARHPERYGQNSRVKLIVEQEVSQEIDRFLEKLRQNLTDEEYEKVAAIAYSL